MMRPHCDLEEIGRNIATAFFRKRKVFLWLMEIDFSGHTITEESCWTAHAFLTSGEAVGSAGDGLAGATVGAGAAGGGG
jgi:hypothetical protein